MIKATMISVKEAAQSALGFAREVLGDSRVNSLLLEEIDLSPDSTEWLVTVSVPAIRLPVSGLATLSAAGIGLAEPRDYKLIHVDSSTGSLKSIKIRKP